MSRSSVTIKRLDGYGEEVYEVEGIVNMCEQNGTVMVENPKLLITVPAKDFVVVVETVYEQD